MGNKNKIILDLCGGTGAWSEPYREANYDVRLVTWPNFDVRLYIPPKHVYGILAAPPCTEFAVSGSRWWKKKGEKPLIEALSVVDACLRIIRKCEFYLKFWALENPVGRLKHFIGEPIFSFDPCDFGDPYTKKTLLWGNFVAPELNRVEPKYIVGKNGKRFSHISWLFLTEHDKEKRTMLRSITPKGFAKAFFEANR